MKSPARTHQPNIRKVCDFEFGQLNDDINDRLQNVEKCKVLFVGINPHPGSYRRGVPFSNNKMFWYLLNRSGLLEETESDLKDDQLLKQIYDRKFLPKYGLNFLNLVDRPTVDVTQLKHGEEQAGVKRALKIIETCKPKVVCFIGKIAFKKFYGIRKCDWGWQAGIKQLESLPDALSNPGSSGSSGKGTTRSEGGE